MNENIKVRWLTDHEQTKVAPKTLSSQVYNEDGTLLKDSIANSLNALNENIAASFTDVNAAIAEKLDKTDVAQANWNQNDESAVDYVKNRTHWVEDDGETIHPLDEKFIPETIATKDYVESLVKKLGATLALSFYCIEDVTVITNGISKIYPANSNVEIVFTDEDVFEIVPTSDQSILALNAYPGALNTYYSWLEGVKQFSNILFDMNSEDMYTKWSQGNQGAYQVQFAQYTNCIFWSDNPYISDVSKRTNYTLCSTSQLPLCYSSIPDNTFKSFYLAFGVTSDPNWSNPVYKESFAKATWATQAFSYYGARIVGFPGHDSSNFNITLPKDCRGLMFDARNIECAGTFDAVNVTNFGAKSGSWREAFGDCTSLRRLYIKNLKVNLNVSWSPIDYNSIYYIISAAANTSKITISVSPYTYNLLRQSDFDLATSKNITIELLTTNYVEDSRLSAIANKADKDHVHDVYETKSDAQTKYDELSSEKKDKDIIIRYTDNTRTTVTHTSEEIYAAVNEGTTVLFNNGGTNFHYLEGAPSVVNFYNCFYNNDVMQADVYEIRGNQITNTHFQSNIIKQSDIDTSVNNLKNDLLNGAGEAYDTLKELGELIDDNQDAIEALEIIATGKADKEHTHSWNDLEDRPFGDINNILYSTDATLYYEYESYTEPSAILSDFDVSIFQFNKYYTIKVNDYTFVLKWEAVYGGVKAFKGYTENGDYFYLYNSGGATSEVRFEKKEWNDNPELTLETYDVHIDISDGEYTKQIEEKFIPDTIARTTYVDSTFARKEDIKDVDLSNYETKEDAQLKYNTIVEAKADWSQNDNTAINYIKNRTHWAEESTEVMLAEQTLEGIDGGDSYITGYYASITGLDNNSLIVGNAYIITVDGVAYRCEAFYTYGEQAIGDSRFIRNYISDDEYEEDQTNPENVPFLIRTWYNMEEDPDSMWGVGNEWWDWDIYFSTTGSHTLKIERVDPDQSTYHTLDANFIPDSIARVTYVDTEMQNKMNVNNPSGTGSFGMNRVGIVGEYSHAVGNKTTASGLASHAEGKETTASGGYSHAEGVETTASGNSSHAEGNDTKASGASSHAEGYRTIASGQGSHAEGYCTVAAGNHSHVQGMFNITDTENKYAHIVGNGQNNDPSNAHTLDWSGNAWYAGTIKVGGTSYNDASEIALKSDLENINVDLTGYYTKEEIDSMEFITTDDIDAICGANIQMASEVMF